MLPRRKSKKKMTREARHRRLEQSEVSERRWLKVVAGWAIGIFIFLLAVSTCFLGQSLAGPGLSLGQVANARITTEFPFEYESRVRTENVIAKKKERVAPVYSLDLGAFESFSQSIKYIEEEFTVLNIRPEEQELTPEESAELAMRIRERTGIALAAEDLAIMANKLSSAERNELFNEALYMLREVLERGVYHEDFFEGAAGANTSMLINFNFSDAESSGLSGLMTHADALIHLRINLTALDSNMKVTRGLYRLFKYGMAPNLVFDSDRTAEQLAEIERSTPPVRVAVRKNDTLIAPGVKVTEEHIEMLAAYRLELNARESYNYGLTRSLLRNLILSSAFFLMSFFALKLLLPHYLKSPKHLALIIVLLLGNLALLRVISEIGEHGLIISNFSDVSILPFLAPVALGAILATVLCGQSLGIIIGLLISAMHTMMHAYAPHVAAFSAVATVSAVYLSHDLRARAKLVRASVMSAIMASFVIIFYSLLQGSYSIIGEELVAVISVGLMTGIIAVGVLPILENAFKFTTNITLLELTDFNHPLLRQMQLKAPGTYHHSLMVANLAERAAAAIGANALQCRVGALFHDIGKMVKPEYFVENQQKGENPHLDRNPSMSALVIKAHIKEGVAMATQHRLPKVIVDSIEQHHGTGLIWYFYHRAKQAKGSGSGDEGPDIDESTYRYDGPKPSSAETAILLLADSVEAASRTLKKASATNIEELVESIFRNHIDDEQLSEAPLTLKELRQVQKSIEFSLLNTLHQRTEYPDRDSGSSEVANDRREREGSGPVRKKEDSVDEEHAV